jgi:hypothetical protein
MRTKIADTLRAAGDELHALARKIDPPDYGVRIGWDDTYEIDGATAWGEPEDSDYAAETRAKLESGEWIVVGMIAVERDRDGTVRETDTPASLWGIVSPWQEAPEFAGKPLDVFELDTLRGYLRTVADDLISEARDPSATPTAFRGQS